MIRNRDKGKLNEIKINLKRLEDVSRYYEFPLAIFLGGKIPRGTRRDNLLKRIRELKEKLINIIDEML